MFASEMYDGEILMESVAHFRTEHIGLIDFCVEVFA